MAFNNSYKGTQFTVHYHRDVEKYDEPKQLNISIWFKENLPTFF